MASGRQYTLQERVEFSGAELLEGTRSPVEDDHKDVDFMLGTERHALAQ